MTARRAIMVDVDGVLVRPFDAPGWSATLEHDIGVSPSRLQQAFFTPHWDDVVHGRASLRDRLSRALAHIAPQVSCEMLIDYWFDRDANIDRRLLREVAGFRALGLETHLATVQEHERAAYLWSQLRLCDAFDGLHYSAALGHAKPDPGFYRAIEARTGLAPEAIFFIDDRPANVAAAIACGWAAAVWDGSETLASLISRAGWLAY